jgi:hypothetical protein
LTSAGVIPSLKPKKVGASFNVKPHFSCAAHGANKIRGSNKKRIFRINFQKIKRCSFDAKTFFRARFAIINKLLRISGEILKKKPGVESTRAKHRLLNVLSLAATAVALAAAIWIVVPAPSYNVWLFSVAASEWSFALSVIALFGIVGALVFGRGKIKAAAVFAGAAALLISLYPFISAFPVARANSVSLSFGTIRRRIFRSK